MTSCKEVPPRVRESPTSFGSSADVLDSIDGPEYAGKTFVLAEGEYWNDTVGVQQNSYSGISRGYHKRTDQILNEVQASHEVGATNTSRAIHNKAQVHTDFADCKT